MRKNVLICRQNLFIPLLFYETSQFLLILFLKFPLYCSTFWLQKLFLKMHNKCKGWFKTIFINFFLNSKKFLKFFTCHVTDLILSILTHKTFCLFLMFSLKARNGKIISLKIQKHARKHLPLKFLTHWRRQRRETQWGTLCPLCKYFYVDIVEVHKK